MAVGNIIVAGTHQVGEVESAQGGYYSNIVVVVGR